MGSHMNQAKIVKYPLLISILGCGLILSTSRAASDEVRFIGDKVVTVDETITGDVVVVTGNLVIRGHVTGSAVAYVGNITLDSTAVVDGDVVAKRGRIYRAPGAVVHGDVTQGRIPGVKIGRDEDGPVIPSNKPSPTKPDEKVKGSSEPKWEFDQETDFKLSYNKVDGLYLGMASESFPFSDYGMQFRTFGSGGYGFSSHSWQGQGGFGFGVLPDASLELSVDAFHLTGTEDAWYMSDAENSLAAFFLHEDFRDYYLREGFGSTLSWEPLWGTNLSVRYQAEQHRTLENSTNWALFGGDKRFLPNLQVEEGMLREFILGAKLDSRDDVDEPIQGWLLQAEIELTDQGLSSDFDFRRAVLDLRRYQPLNDFVNLDTRVRLGNSEGILPPQKRFYLGGPSSLPGFGLKEFSGREFALWNAEVRLHDDGRGRDGWFENLGLFFFADVGMADDQPLAEMKAQDWASDVGVGISAASGTLRLQVAKRTDTAYDPYVWMLRVQRPF